MKAAQLTSYDGPSAVVINDIDKPSIASNQVLVKVTAAGVNPFDWKVTMGYAKDWVDLQFPATIGADVSGTVEETGSEVTSFGVGQQVYGSGNTLSGNGSFAEYVPVDASALALAPVSIDLAAVAAFPLPAVSAYQALVKTANLQSGQKILIHGGAGGIGSQAIQMAHAIGAHVATTAGPDDLDYVRGLGADEAYDYTSDDFTQHVSEYDVVFDTVGGETYAKSFTVLRQGGQLLSMVQQPDEALAAQHGVTATYMSTGSTTEDLKAVAQMIDDGKLTINIHKTFPLEQTAEALALVKDGHVRGKVTLTV